MRKLLVDYWLVGGVVADLRFRNVSVIEPIGAWPHGTAFGYRVEAVDKNTGLPQFNCRHVHETWESCQTCKEQLMRLQRELESNLVR